MLTRHDTRDARSSLARSLACGVIAAVLVGVAGVIGAWSRPEVWTARSTLMVLPDRRVVPAEAVVAYYETLNQGQIVATYAGVLDTAHTETAAADRLKLSPEARRSTQVTVEVVPDTALIRIVARSSSAEIALGAASAMAEVAPGIIESLGQPFTVITVGQPEDAEAAGTGMAVLLGAIFIIAVAAGFLAQQAWLALSRVSGISRVRGGLSGPRHVRVPQDSSPLAPPQSRGGVLDDTRDGE